MFSTGELLKSNILADRPTRISYYATYTPLPIPICGTFAPASTKTPWSPSRSLKAEIASFVAYMSPTPAERQMRSDLLARFKTAISKLQPTNTVTAVGSYVTGLYTPSGDIDVVLRPITLPSSIWTIQRDMRQIESNLNTVFPCKIKSVWSAKVPVLRITDDVTGLQIDLTGDLKHSVATMNAVMEWEARMDLKHGTGVMRGLVLVLKTLLAMRKLNKTYTGGVNSYVVVWMVVAYLEIKGAAGGLLGLLKWYGQELDHENYRISFRGSMAQLDYGYRDSRQPYLLKIMDPLGDEDLGRKIYAYEHVRATLRECAAKLEMAKLTAKMASLGGTVSEESGVLGSILGGNWDTFTRQRKEAVMKQMGGVSTRKKVEVVTKGEVLKWRMEETLKTEKDEALRKQKDEELKKQKEEAATKQMEEAVTRQKDEALKRRREEVASQRDELMKRYLAYLKERGQQTISS